METKNRNEKVVLFAFNGEAMCFTHVMLYALDLNQKGYETGIVIEGAAVKLVETLNNPEAPFHALYNQIKDKELIYGVCKACSAKMKSLESAKDQKFKILDDIKGHPSIEPYIADGYRIVTF